MKSEIKTIYLAILATTIFWVTDSLLASSIADADTFLNILILNIPPRALHMRILASIAFFCYGIAVAYVYKKQQKHGQEHRNKSEQFEAAQQQLKASNQQLAANEQQLKATNQQLRAGNQQIRAAEQQLRATNQQLIASENALRIERDRAQQYLDVAAVIMLVLDTKGKVTLINAKGCEILGYNEDYIIGKDWVNNFIPESERTMVDKKRNEVTDKPIDANQFENHVLCKNNEIRSINWHNTTLKDEDGMIIGILCSGSDVTDQRTAETHEKTLKEQLARAERMESLGILAGGVAHDLNNILGPMVTLPEIMIDDLNSISTTDDISELKEDLLSMKDASKTAADVIRDLMTLSRRGHYETIPTDISKMIANYIQGRSFKKLIDEYPGVSFETSFAQDILPVSASESHMVQVLINLATNALEAMPHGGQLSMTTSNIYIDKHKTQYETIMEGEYVVLTVSDTGSGIPEEDIPRIFEPFYTKKKMGHKSGTGLGLAVVYGVTKDHDGYVDVQSEKGVGTTFTLYLPIAREDIPIEEIHTTLPTGNESILVVDDIPQQRRIPERLLSKLGYTITTTDNGKNAIKLIEKIKRDNPKPPFDLLILDMIMEDDMDGLDTYRAYLDIYPNQKCILVSGFSETERASETMKLGAGQFLTKPYTLEKLATAVRKELDA